MNPSVVIPRLFLLQLLIRVLVGVEDAFLQRGQLSGHGLTLRLIPLDQRPPGGAFLLPQLVEHSLGLRLVTVGDGRAVLIQAEGEGNGHADDGGQGKTKDHLQELRHHG